MSRSRPKRKSAGPTSVDRDSGAAAAKCYKSRRPGQAEETSVLVIISSQLRSFSVSSSPGLMKTHWWRHAAVWQFNWWRLQSVSDGNPVVSSRHLVQFTRKCQIFIEPLVPFFFQILKLDLYLELHSTAEFKLIKIKVFHCLVLCSIQQPPSACS